MQVVSLGLFLPAGTVFAAQAECYSVEYIGVCRPCRGPSLRPELSVWLPPLSMLLLILSLRRRGKVVVGVCIFLQLFRERSKTRCRRSYFAHID